MCWLNDASFLWPVTAFLTVHVMDKKCIDNNLLENVIFLTFISITKINARTTGYNSETTCSNSCQKVKYSIKKKCVANFLNVLSWANHYTFYSKIGMTLTTLLSLNVPTINSCIKPQNRILKGNYF